MAIDIIARGMAANAQGGGGDLTNYYTKAQIDALFRSKVEPVVVEVTNYIEVPNGYVIPDLSIDDITKLYNGLVAGKVTLVSEDGGQAMYPVSIASSYNDDIAIGFVYWTTMLVTYTITQGEVKYLVEEYALMDEIEDIDKELSKMNSGSGV